MTPTGTLIAQPRSLTRRAFAVLVLHLAAFVLCYWLAFTIRFQLIDRGRTSVGFWSEVAAWFSLTDLTLEERMVFIVTLPALLIIKGTLFYAFGHCHQSWRYVTFSDMAAIIRTAFLGTLFIATIDHFVATKVHNPRGVLVIDFVLTVLVLGAARAAWRFAHEEFRPLFYRNTAPKALIVGANPSGETLARHLMTDPRRSYRVVGYLDPDKGRHGSMLGTLPVLGDPAHAAHYARSVGVEHILVISDVLTGQQLRSLMAECQQAEIGLKVIPALDDLLESNYGLQVRDVEINDLLRREPVQLNNEAISRLIENRVILVTGAGGSIGSEICRQVLRFKPRKLLLLERAENSLFFIEQELLRSTEPGLIVPCLADITDAERLRHVFGQWRPEVVFHAAAHKHVPMMEYNPGEAVKNNVLGTRLLAETAEEFGVNEFVMISTDKAVNPTSVMGVSKHLAERFIHALSEKAKTKFVAVRFGNVLASNGSVVPIFQEQIRRGGPITVTHPDIERYFMTIPEASQLVLQAAAMGKGGEIFVLDMGESVRIVDLAHDLIRLSGLQPDDIEIVFTGLRPGEKLYEELYFDEEEMLATPHEKVFVAYHRNFSLDDVRQSILRLAEYVHGDPEGLRRALKELVPEYLQVSAGSKSPQHPSQRRAATPPTDQPATTARPD